MASSISDELMKGETMRRWKKAALITVGILFLLAGFVAFGLPGIVKSLAVQRIEAATGRKLGIGRISINLFTWTVAVRDFSFTERGGGETFAAISSARITVSPLSLYRRAPIIAAARITSPHFRIVRIGANVYNFSDLLKWLPLVPHLSINNLTITNGSIEIIDRGLPVEKRHELRKIELAVPFITTMKYYDDRYITPRLSAVLNGSPLHIEGRFRPFPRVVEASGTVEFKDVALPYYLEYAPGKLPVRVESGMVSAKGAVNYRAAQMKDPDLTLIGSVTLANMKVNDRTGAPFLSLVRLETEITRARLLAGEYDLSSISADGLEVFLMRDKKGVLSHSRLAGRASPGAAPRRKALVRVKETRLGNGKFHFIDSRPPGGFRTDMTGISLNMRDYSTFPGKMASYALSFTTVRGEKGNLKGEFSPLPLATSSSLELTGLALKAYTPYLPKNFTMVVANGKGDANLAVSLAAKGGRLTGTFGGSVGIRSLHCLDSERKDLLKWDSLQFEKMKGSLNPFALDIGDVVLTRFYSRIVVEKDGSLNLQHVYTRKPERIKKNSAAEEKRSLVRIGNVTLRDGTLAFTDHHVTGGYTTALFNLGGQVKGLSSEENRFADVDLHGNLENKSPLRITGRLNPLRNELFADLKVSFTDIELSHLTRYSETYLGYAVDKGQLFLNSNYRIENRKLDLENKVFIDQLRFGKRIESDKETIFPVTLAVALLKDQKGEIRLDLPVKGRTDDPKFSIWRVALDTLKNLFVTTTKSPFAHLQSMFGGKEDLSSVGFASGSTELSPGEREKLLKLATALKERPELKIGVVGFVDRERDHEGYRNKLQFQSLADARADEVRLFLVKQGRVDSARVFQKSGDIYRAPGKVGEPGSRVEFEAATE